MQKWSYLYSIYIFLIFWFHPDLAFNVILWQWVPQVNNALHRKFLRSLFHFLLPCLSVTHTSHKGGQELPNLPYIMPIIFYTSVLFVLPSDYPLLPKAAIVCFKYRCYLHHWQFMLLFPEPFYFCSVVFEIPFLAEASHWSPWWPCLCKPFSHSCLPFPMLSNI